MAHHKRRRPKSARAGCLACKAYKHQRMGKYSAKQRGHSHRRVLQPPVAAIRERLANDG